MEIKFTLARNKREDKFGRIHHLDAEGTNVKWKEQTMRIRVYDKRLDIVGDGWWSREAVLVSSALQQCCNCLTDPAGSL